VHRNVVCVTCKVLAAAVNGSWKEGVTGEILLDSDEDDSNAVEKMVELRYVRSCFREENAITVIRPYIMGDK